MNQNIAKRKITLVFSSSDSFVPYLCVALESLKRQASQAYIYEIFILERDISNNRKQQIKTVLNTSQFYVIFVNMNQQLSPFQFLAHHHISLETFFKLFIPVLFKNYDRVLFCDADIIFQEDPSLLFFNNLDGKKIGASLCHLWHAVIQKNKKNKEYTRKILGLKNPNRYFQAGILLFDPKKITDSDMENILLFAQKRHYSCMDQDVLNACFKKDVCYLSSAWNYETPQRGFLSHIPYMDQYHINLWEDASKAPKIIHYSGENKPWYDPSETMADIWWTYAQKTPFYEEIISRMVKRFSQKQMLYRYTKIIYTCSLHRKNKIKYFIYKLSVILLGEKRLKYGHKWGF